MSNDLRQLHLRGALGAVRTEMWGGREHLVVPMVALMEGVIHAVNAKHAELVTADALARSADKWNGHPIVVGHPVKDGKQISAHDPQVLEQHGCGFIRQASMNGKRLGMEALIDPAKLERIGHKALAEDLRIGKGCEVSVGAYVGTNGNRGEHNGKKYEGEWIDIGPDHTALLPGSTGACSMEMGCGAHRMAERYLVTAEGFEALRDISQKQRDKMPESDFAGPGTSFPIKTQADVDAAAHLVGKAANPDEVKKNIIAIAKRKGLTIPKAWRTAGGPGSGRHAEGDRVVVHAPSSEHHGKTGTISSTKGNVHSVSDMYGNQLGKFSSSQLKAAANRSTVMDLKKLKARVLALFDTPEQAASEEAAELVAYNAMRALFDGVGNQWDEASGLIDDLIADETENPTQTAGQEEAEEEVESARLEAIRMLCYAMSSALNNVVNATYGSALTDDLPPTSDPRYMEAFRAAVGKAISAKNMKTIQAAHDSAHDMHAQTVALGAECNGMKLLADKTMKDCPTCDGMGQIDGKDCATCEGSGTLKTAESGTAAKGDTIMTAEQKAAALKTLAACGCDKKFETDEQIVTALTEAVDAGRAKIKTLETAKPEVKELTKDEILKASPEIAAIVAEHEARVAAEKTTLVKALEAAKVLTAEQLAAKPIEELRTMAAFAKVEAPDYGGRGVAVPRQAQSGEDYTPPKPYDAVLKSTSKAVN